MEEAKFNTPVALIFFTRPNTFKHVFSQIKKIKPKKLFLIQDGPRIKNLNDLKKIMECRRIAENIDWKCEIHKNYSDVNLGCGMRPASGIAWVFKFVDRAIILEDDCVPNLTFFPYCERLLEKYKNDERITMISGRNHFIEWDCGGYSYCFAKEGSTAGWATWKRIFNKYDYEISAFNIEKVKNLLYNDFYSKRVAKERIRNLKSIREKLKNNEKLSCWDYQFKFLQYTQSGLSIVPKYNQIKNIGTGSDSTHAKNTLKCTPKKIAKLFFMETKALDFPLKEPEFVICDREYDKGYNNIAYPNFIDKLIRKLEICIRKYFNFN